MSQTNFRVITAAFATIANRLKYAVYEATSPNAEIQPQIFVAPHPERTVNFLNLNHVNHIFRLMEIDGAGAVIRYLIPDMNFTPDNNQWIYYQPVEIQVDVTTGVVGGATSFIFDGTAGTFDWRNRDIFVERVGQGTMQLAVQYTWDKVLGRFDLIQAGDTLQSLELFNVEFAIIVQQGGATPQPPLFADVMVIDNDAVLTQDDIGKKIIVKGAVPFLTVTMPDATTCREKVVTWVEFGIGAHINAQFLTVGGQVFDYGKGNRDNMTGGVCESFAFYKEPLTGLWRVHDADGNFLKVGRMFYSDAEEADEMNALELNGQTLDSAIYWRLYNDFVDSLPPAQVCNFIDWGTGNNKYKFSLKDGSGNFKIPDRRDIVVKQSGAGRVPGIYEADRVGPITGATFPLTHGNSYTGGPNSAIFGNGANSPQVFNYTVAINTGNAETTVKTVSQKQYVLI